MRGRQLSLLAGIITAIAQTAWAQNTPTKVGIINIQGAIVNTKDGQKAIKELEARFAPKKQEIEKKQEKIRELQAQLQKGSSVLSEEQKRKLMNEIDQHTKEYNRNVEDASQELEQEQGKIFQELSQKMMAVIDKHAKEKGFAVILDVSSQQTPVLYAANEVDITRDIIELYDKQSAAASAPAPATKPAPPQASPKPATPAPKKQ